MRSSPRTVCVVTARTVQGGIDHQDVPMVQALRARGLAVEARCWDDASVDWTGYGICVVRSTWDYYLRYDEFCAWLDRMAALGANLHNPAPLVRWNVHKGYLMQLAGRGVAVVPTAYLARGQPVALPRLLEDRGWTRVVIKPAVSAGAHRTVQAHARAPAEAQPHLDALLADSEVLVQPYLDAVETVGERSLIFLDGHFSHALRKRSAFELRPGERAQVTRVAPEADELEAANRALEAAGGRSLLYARVDLLRTADGVPRLMELEATEPCLFFLDVPEAADRMAAAIERRLA